MNTLYNVWTFKPLGLRKYIRQQAHVWGVETLSKIIKAERKLQEDIMKKPIVQKTIVQTKKAKSLALEKTLAVKEVKDKAMEKTIQPVK